jgi:RNA methyltransferase, TrmH family
MLSKNQIKEIQSLHQRKQRALQRRFIAEGAKTVSEILQQKGGLIDQLFATRHFIQEHGVILEENKIVFQEITEDELRKISLQTTPNQVLAVCHYLEETAPARPAATAFYLDDIRDPGNLGTIIRLSDWFGMRQLYCSPSTCDLYNPKVIQSCMGAFLRVNIHYLPLEDLRGYKTIYGAVLTGDNLYSSKLSEGLIVIGNEANGISAENMRLLTHKLHIPAAADSKAESLNAAIAAAVLASEFFRQQQDQ